MSKEIISKLENDLNKVLKEYEDNYEITAAEVCGVLSIIRTDKAMRALLPFCKDFLKDLLELPAISEGGAPVGKIVTLEGKERN